MFLALLLLIGIIPIVGLGVPVAMAVIAIDCLLLFVPLSEGYSHPKRSVYDQYASDLAKHETDKKNYELTLRTFWTQMHPHDFEHEIAALFRVIGYQADVTKYVGDGGVDIRLAKDGSITLVQCKRTQTPIGPAPIRELYGVMMHEAVFNGIVVCTGGFTRGAKDFVKGKSIRLLSLDDILSLQSDKNFANR